MSEAARTYRVVGVAVAAAGRAVDLALVETDGADYVRPTEIERRPLAAGALAAGVIAATRAFMGDRALQPFAVDHVALAAETADLTVAALAAGIEVDTRLGDSSHGERGGGRAERAAFAVVAWLLSPEGNASGGASRGLDAKTYGP